MQNMTTENSETNSSNNYALISIKLIADGKTHRSTLQLIELQSPLRNNDHWTNGYVGGELKSRFLSWRK